MPSSSVAVRIKLHRQSAITRKGTHGGEKASNCSELYQERCDAISMPFQALEVAVLIDCPEVPIHCVESASVHI